MTEKALNYVAGEWIWPKGRAEIESRNPADWREVVAVLPASDAEDVNQAVAAAKAAFTGWRRTPPPARAECIRRAGEALKREKSRLAELICREMGKPWAEAAGDVQESIDMAALAAGEGQRLHGLTVPSELPNKLCMTFREPVGVCGLITPWNFPTAIPAWKAFHALVCGCPFILKPSRDVSLCAAEFIKCLTEGGFPKGVIGLIHGAGGSVGEALIDHPDVRLIAFTGSSVTGAHISSRCGALNKNCSMEMGGKNAQIVLADANLDLAIDGALWGAFGTCGQRCTATSRLIVDAAVHDRVVDRLAARAKGLKLGHGGDKSSELCPVINESQYKSVLDYIQIGRNEGAHLICGGASARKGALEHGWFIEPTIFTGVSRSMRIFKEEIFGPVLSVVKCNGVEEAVEILNDSEFGLSSSIYTSNMNAAFWATREIEAGICYINGPTIGAEVQLPFGGVKATGNGHREAGQAGLDIFSEWKTVYLDYSGKLQKAQIDTAAD